MRFDVLTYPIREFSLTKRTIGQGQHRRDHVGVGGLELIAVETEEGGHGEEADPLVAVTVRMIPHQVEAVCGGQGRDVRGTSVRPLLTWSRQGRFERVLVAHRGKTAMLAKLVGVDGVDDGSTEPGRFSSPPGHAYFASSRSALRYFLAVLAAIPSARSTSGS